MFKYLILAMILGWAQLSFAELLVHWSFDELTGNQFADNAGKNPVLINGGIPGEYLVPGLKGSAIRFEPGRISACAKHAVELSLKDDFTVEYEINPEAVTGYRSLIWKGNRKVTPEAINYYFGIRDGKFEFKSKDAKGKWVVFQTGKIAEPNKWYHVITTYKNSECEMFVNGKKAKVSVFSEAGRELNALIPNKFDCQLGRGADSRGAAFFFIGLVDDFKIYRGRNVMIAADYMQKRGKLLQDFEQKKKQLAAIAQQRNVEHKQKLSAMYKKFWEQHVKESLSYVVLPTSFRSVKKPDFFIDLTDADTKINIHAAGNEYEGAQILILGDPEKVTQVTKVSCSDLIGPGGQKIPSTQITIGKIGIVNSERPDIPIDFVGGFPDPIFNGDTALNVAVQDFASVYVKIYTGAAASGTYCGSITVKTTDSSQIIPVEVRVFDFSLPVKSSLKNALCFFEQYYRQWYGKATLSLDERLKIYDFLLSYRISPVNIYHSGSEYPKYDALNKIKDRTTFFTLQGWGGAKQKLESKINEYAKEISQAEKSGLFDMMYFYSFDEVSAHPKNIPEAKRVAAAMKKAFPKLKLMQTSFPTPEIRDSYNAWVPLLDYFVEPENKTVLKKMKDRGDEVWWYLADAPTKPFPNFFLDYPVFDCRIIGLLSYMYQVDGLLYWCINREWTTNMDIKSTWPQAAWKPYIFHASLKTRKSKNGMGNLIYPGKNGEILPSLRLENLRDGLEDYEYLTRLKTLMAEVDKAGGNKGILCEAQKLLNIPIEVAKAVDDYSSTPVHLLKYREQVAKMIEKLSKEQGK